MPSAASLPSKPAPSGWPKPLLSVLLGSTLLMSPMLVGSAPTTDMALIVAMSTVNDVRESLDEKLTLLSQACEEYRVLEPGSREAQALERGVEVHFQNAKDIQELALSFLGNSSQRFPEYTRYWENYRQRLLDTWQKVRVLHEALQRAPEAPELASTPPVARPASKNAQPSETAHAIPAASVLGDAAEDDGVASHAGGPPEPKTLMAGYRDAYKKYNEGTPQSADQARLEFEALIRREPAFHLARYWLARILLSQGRPADARRHAQTLVNDQPGLRMARNLLAEAEAACSKEPTPRTAGARTKGRLTAELGGPAVAAATTGR